MINIEEFPIIADENSKGRKVVFDFLSDEERETLIGRGYAPIELRTLKRDTPNEAVQYLVYVLQGGTDGTLKYDKSRLESMYLELRARGLLSNKSVNLSVTASLDSDDLNKLLDWSSSRHTLDNTTIIDPKQIEAMARGALSNVAKPKDKKK